MTWLHRGFDIWKVAALLVAGACTPAAVGAQPEPNSAPPPTREAQPHEPTQDWQKLVDEWDHPAPIPDFELVNQAGKSFRLSELADGYVLVGLVFSHCQVRKACPLTMTKMREVQVAWGQRQAQGETEGRVLRLLSLTLDPDNDTPRALQEYGKLYDVDFSNWTLATGPNGLMRKGLPSLIGVLALPDRKGTINHGVKAALWAPGLNEIRAWDNNDFEAEDVVTAVLNHSSPGPEAGTAPD